MVFGPKLGDNWEWVQGDEIALNNLTNTVTILWTLNIKRHIDVKQKTDVLWTFTKRYIWQFLYIFIFLHFEFNIIEEVNKLFLPRKLQNIYTLENLSY